MKILLISYYFPPINAVASLRTGKWAKFLVRMGHDVRVLAADTSTSDQSQPVEIGSEYVVRAKNFFERSTIVDVIDSPDRRGQNHDWGIRSIARRLVYPLENCTPLTSDLWRWLPRALRASREVLNRWRPDIIVGSYGPPASLIASSLVSRQYGIPWVADYRDLWAGNAVFRRNKLIRAVDMMLERYVVRSAAALTTVSKPLAAVLGANHGKAVHVIPNGFDSDDYSRAVESIHESRLTINYFGTVYPRYQSPALLLQTLAHYPKLAEAVLVSFFGTDPNALAETATHYRIGSDYQVYPRLPYVGSLKRQMQSDVLLFLDWLDSAELGMVTGKIYEYIGARRPILALGNHATEASMLIEQLGVGRICMTETEVFEQLSMWIELKSQQGTISSTTSSGIYRFTRESQTKQLASILEDIVLQTVA